MDRFANTAELYGRKRRSVAESLSSKNPVASIRHLRIPSDEQDFKTFLAAFVPTEKEMKKQACPAVRDLSDAERHTECRAMCKW